MSIALTNRVAKLETQLAAILTAGTVQGIKMQLGRTEKKVNEAVKRLQAIEPVLEAVQLDVDKVRAELGEAG